MIGFEVQFMYKDCMANCGDGTEGNPDRPSRPRPSLSMMVSFLSRFGK